MGGPHRSQWLLGLRAHGDVWLRSGRGDAERACAFAEWAAVLPLCLLVSVTGGHRSSAAWRLKIGTFIYVVGKPFAGLILECSDILFFRNVDPLQCRVSYIVGMGKRVASALVLRRDVFDIASHECLLVLCAQRGKPCLEAEAGEEFGWELLPYLLLLLSSYRVLTVSIEPFRMRCSYWLGRYVGMCPGAYSDPAKETDSLPHSGRFAD